MAKAFIAQEEVSLSVLDRATKIPTELITLQSGLRIRSTGGRKLRIEEIPGIKPIVTDVVISFAVKLFRAGACGDVYDGS